MPRFCEPLHVLLETNFVPDVFFRFRLPNCLTFCHTKVKECDFVCQMWLMWGNSITFVVLMKNDMQNLPQDPMMLFSVINMKLRDYYRSLDELCEDMNIDKEELIQKLAAFGFEYSEENNKFW